MSNDAENSDFIAAVNDILLCIHTENSYFKLEWFHNLSSIFEQISAFLFF